MRRWSLTGIEQEESLPRTGSDSTYFKLRYVWFFDVNEISSYPVSRIVRTAKIDIRPCLLVVAKIQQTRG